MNSMPQEYLRRCSIFESYKITSWAGLSHGMDSTAFSRNVSIKFYHTKTCQQDKKAPKFCYVHGRNRRSHFMPRKQRKKPSQKQSKKQVLKQSKKQSKQQSQHPSKKQKKTYYSKRGLSLYVQRFFLGSQHFKIWKKSILLHKFSSWWSTFFLSPLTFKKKLVSQKIASLPTHVFLLVFTRF